MLAWVTPDDPPGDPICVKVWLPEGIGYEACLKGALLSLTEEINWEQVDGQDADVVAQAFADAYQDTLKWEACMPAGAIMYFAADNVPDGFLECDGAEYDVEDFSVLFAAIGYFFGGSGDVFNVPNMRNRMPVGAGLTWNFGDTGGFKRITLDIDEMPAHTHTLNETIIPTTPGAPTPTVGFSAVPTLQTGPRGGGQSHENMPPYTAMLALIAYR